MMQKLLDLTKIRMWLCCVSMRQKLRPIPVGISAELLVGQKVYANGNPGEIVSLALERLLGEWLQALLYYLLRLQFGLHGGVAVNHKNISLMHLLKRIQKFIWASLQGFLCENYKWQLAVLAIRTFWLVEV